MSINTTPTKTLVVAFQAGKKRVEVARAYPSTVLETPRTLASAISVAAAQNNGRMVNWTVRDSTLPEALALVKRAVRDQTVFITPESDKVVVGGDDGEILYADTMVEAQKLLASA